MKEASKLKLARVTQGISQIELGQKIGKSQNMISHFETGRLRASARDRKKIARVLKTREDVLFG